MADDTSFDLAHAEGGRRFGAVLARTIYAGVPLHAERFPTSGPALVVSNHTGFLDGPLVYCLMPRPVHFLVKRAYFSNAALGWLLRTVGQIPITQNSGDREALAAARSVLAQGECVGIFPEGTRGSGSVRTAQQGAAWLALQSGATIVPVATLGTRPTGSGRSAWPRPRAKLRVGVGQPFTLPAYDGMTGRAKLAAATEEIRVRLAAHVEQAVAETGLALPA